MFENPSFSEADLPPACNDTQLWWKEDFERIFSDHLVADLFHPAVFVCKVDEHTGLCASAVHELEILKIPARGMESFSCLLCSQFQVNGSKNCKP